MYLFIVVIGSWALEAEKTHSMLSPSWRPRKVSGISQLVSESLRARSSDVWRQERWMSQLKKRERICPSFTFFSTLALNGLADAHSDEGRALYPLLSQMLISSRNSLVDRKHSSTTYLGTPEPSHVFPCWWESSFLGRGATRGWFIALLSALVDLLMQYFNKPPTQQQLLEDWGASLFSFSPSFLFEAYDIQYANTSPRVFLHHGSDCHAISPLFLLVSDNMKNLLCNYVYIPRNQNSYVSIFCISSFFCIKSQNQLYYSQKKKPTKTNKKPTTQLRAICL